MNLAVLGAVTSELALANHSDLTVDQKIDKALIKFDAIRGTWFGFNRGLYTLSGATDMESVCMDEATRDRFAEAYEVYLGYAELPEGADWLKAFGDMVKVSANLVDCEFRKPVEDIKHYCHTEAAAINTDGFDVPDIEAPKPPCSFGGVLEHLQKNAFVLMSKGSQMGEVFQSFPPEDPAQMEEAAMTLALDVASLIRVGLDFNLPPPV